MRYLSLAEAAVLAGRIARDHPLSDGNKRLPWRCLTMSCLLNSWDLDIDTDDAVDQMLGVAAGEIDEASQVGGRRLLRTGPFERGIA